MVTPAQACEYNKVFFWYHVVHGHSSTVDISIVSTVAYWRCVVRSPTYLTNTAGNVPRSLHTVPATQLDVSSNTYRAGHQAQCIVCLKTAMHTRGWTNEVCLMMCISFAVVAVVCDAVGHSCWTCMLLLHTCKPAHDVFSGVAARCTLIPLCVHCTQAINCTPQHLYPMHTQW